MAWLSNFKRFAAAISALSIMLGAACIWRLQIYPSGAFPGDAHTYYLYAKKFADQGFLSDFGSIRTYGYPLFLSFIIRIFGDREDVVALVCGLTQYIFFVVSVISLALSIKTFSELLSRVVLVSLLLNPMVAGLVTDTMSDGFAIPITIAVIALAVRSDRAMGNKRFLILSLLGTLLSSFCVMVRPASLILFSAWHISVIVRSYFRSELKQRALNLSVYTLGSLIITLAVFGPQFAYNLQTWGTASPLPVCDISKLQLQYGIASLRYDAVVLKGDLSPYAYVNGLVSGESLTGSAADYYLARPVVGTATVIGHWIESFNVNAMFVYVYDGVHRSGVLLAFMYFVIFGLGLRTVFGLLSSRFDVQFRVHVQSICLITLLTAGVVAINGVTAVELRFNAIPIAVLTVLGCYYLTIANWRAEYRSIVIILSLAGLSTAGTEALRRQGRIVSLAEIVPFDAVAARCHLFAASAPTYQRRR